MALLTRLAVGLLSLCGTHSIIGGVSAKSAMSVSTKHVAETTCVYSGMQLSKAYVTEAVATFCTQADVQMIAADAPLNTTHTVDGIQLDLIIASERGHNAHSINTDTCLDGFDVLLTCSDENPTTVYGGTTSIGGNVFIVEIGPWCAPHCLHPDSQEPIHAGLAAREISSPQCTSSGPSIPASFFDSEVSAFCQAKSGLVIVPGHNDWTEYKSGGEVLILQLHNGCEHHDYTVDTDTCIAAFNGLNTCSEPTSGSTKGGSLYNGCAQLSAKVVPFGSTIINARDSEATELTSTTSKISSRGCGADKSAPGCHISQFGCNWDSEGYSIDWMADLIVAFCDSTIGAEINSGAWANYTWTGDVAHGHTVTLGTHNMQDSKTFVGGNHCIWNFGSLEGWCGDGVADYSGYIWVPPYQGTWFIDIDSGLPPGPFCDGSC